MWNRQYHSWTLSTWTSPQPSFSSTSYRYNERVDIITILWLTFTLISYLTAKALGNGTAENGTVVVSDVLYTKEQWARILQA